jgi:hypothetical protein
MNDEIETLLATDEAALATRWDRLQRWLRERFGKKEASIESILFLIGVQARGRGYEPKLEKDVKQRVIMEGTYHVFETLGFYQHAGMEADGAWIWERLVDLPELTVEDQEKLLRLAILRYFEPYLQTYATE